MAETIFIGVAWPYADGSLQLGNLAGADLPADILARYHRLKGNRVLMVSGSDQHGTPITIKAEQEGRSPQEIVDHYQREFLDCWQKLGISFDLFTTTGTANHQQVAQDILLKLMDEGYIYRNTVSQLYCPHCHRFLPDRYVEGVCPNCGTPGARGDQCDNCGKPLNPTELIEPRCRVCGATPVLQDSEHLFLKLSAFQEKLEQWVGRQSQWKPNVLGLTQRYLKEGLRDRAITRDIGWGIPVPVKGFENKRIYVWFEAVIGYLSASKQWAAETPGDKDRWHDFWDEDKGAKSYYFLGKDNIPFHTIIWPAMLMGLGPKARPEGYGGLNLPYDVPANEFLTLEGKKISKSRHWAVWLPDYLARYDPDPLRYLLSINMPESSDTDFSWREFVRRNNDELVAAYGNLVNRVLTFVYRNFEGKVPRPGKLSEADNALIKSSDETLAQVGEFISQCCFKQAILAAMSLARDVNRFLDDRAPWKAIKQDRPAAADSLYTAIMVISRLKTMFYPFLPFTSQKVHEYLGFGGRIEDTGWRPHDPQPGQPLREPKPLFTKLDESIIEEENKRIGA